MRVTRRSLSRRPGAQPFFRLSVSRGACPFAESDGRHGRLQAADRNVPGGEASAAATASAAGLSSGRYVELVPASAWMIFGRHAVGEGTHSPWRAV